MNVATGQDDTSFLVSGYPMARTLGQHPSLNGTAFSLQAELPVVLLAQTVRKNSAMVHIE